MKTSFILALAIALSCVAAKPALAATTAPKAAPAATPLSLASHQRAEIRSVIERYGQALNAGNVDAIVQLYTPEGAVLAPNAPTAVGEQAVHDSYVATFQAISLDIAFQIAEIHLLAPDWAYARSTSSGTIRIIANGQVVPEANQELFVLRRLRGEWKIARYAFSTTLPAAN